MSRFLRAITPALVLFLMLATAADAGPAWREIGEYKDNPLPGPGFKAGCEGSTPAKAKCKAIAHLTGYQTQFGSHRNKYVVNHRGKITAVTLRLGNPTKNQLKFFTTNFGAPTIRLSVLKGQGKRHDVRGHTDLRLVGQSEAIDVSKYLGSKHVTFVLANSVPVPAKSTIALTVPTWAPVFTINRPKNETWRASTPKGKCEDASIQSAHQTVGSVKFYDCFFKGARLLYTATFLRDPAQTKK